MKDNLDFIYITINYFLALFAGHTCQSLKAAQAALTSLHSKSHINVCNAPDCRDPVTFGIVLSHLVP